jgi:alanine racemase
MLFSQLPAITPGHVQQLAHSRPVEIFLTDSRKAVAAETACFFAMTGPRHDGHRYLADLYAQGVRQFVVERPVPQDSFPDANFFVCASALTALQHVAAWHRQQFHYPVVGITGSNGKTIIKEWLYQLLSPDFNVVKNPGSYNSQLGVALSVLQMRSHHQLAVFEAGISRPKEMDKLEPMIHPTIGIFSNVGPAHDEGFASRQQKVEEKLQLFSNAALLIYCRDHEEVHRQAQHHRHALSWGRQPDAAVRVQGSGRQLQVTFGETTHDFVLPVQDPASIENLTHCLVLMLHLGIGHSSIQERIRHLRAVPMRLELKQAIHQCQLIDDAYNNDLAGLQISLEFLAAQQKRKKTVILSDILQSGLTDAELAQQVAARLRSAGIQKLVAVGPGLTRHQGVFDFLKECAFFHSTEEMLAQYPFDRFQQELILLKGARPFRFELIAQRLQKKIHGTVMEIDLDAMVHNLNFFRSKLRPGVKVMAMVKAFAYGSGSEEVANLLQYHKVDYLGVAYADEGVELRQNHIALPIMVMNPSEESFDTMLAHQLEPEVYSLRVLRALITFLEGRPCKIHLKLDTGMHRLGFQQADLPEALALLRQHPHVQLATVFTHLAGADEARHDAFSQAQAHAFEQMYQQVWDTLKVKPVRHVLNSPGILRLPQYQFDMVRLGVGLYGVNPTSEEFPLKPVATLKTVISQVKTLRKGATIGYGRWGQADKDMTIATIAIGYADGFSRAFSKGVGAVSIRGQMAPVVGNVCMDMTMVDVTGLGAEEGDEVIVFGKELPIYEVARRIHTIPYEILTNTSERVKRVFYAESI